MKGRLPILITALMLLMMLPQPALAGPQTDVLNHFVTVPVPGLAAEGVLAVGHTFYVSTINFDPTATAGSIFAFNSNGDLLQTLSLPGLPIVGQAAAYKDSLFVVACSATLASGAVVKIDLKTGSVDTGFAPIPTGCPNGLTMDGHGNMYVADFAGGIDMVTQSGDVTFNWATGALLAAGASGIGPNDIMYNHKMNAVFTTNTGLNTVVEIPVSKDGSAGTVTAYATVPGPDGLVFDQKGDLYVASPFANMIFVVTPDGSVSPMSFTGNETLYSPSAVILQGNTMYITNLDLSFAPPPTPPTPYPSGYVSMVQVHPPKPVHSSPLTFTAQLSPVVAGSHASGEATFSLSPDGTILSYKLTVKNIENVFMAHIHISTTGNIAVWLYPYPNGVSPTGESDCVAVLGGGPIAACPGFIPGKFSGVLAQGTITAADLTGPQTCTACTGLPTPPPPATGPTMASLVSEMVAGNTYVNVHTEANPGGEIQGTIHANLGPGANLQWANLQGLDLSGLNMAGDNLQHANLQGAILTGANLHGANLQWADLSGATLFGTASQSTNFDGANMQHAMLNNADCGPTPYPGNYITAAGANTQHADLTGAVNCSPPF